MNLNKKFILVIVGLLLIFITKPLFFLLIPILVPAFGLWSAVYFAMFEGLLQIIGLLLIFKAIINYFQERQQAKDPTQNNTQSKTLYIAGIVLIFLSLIVFGYISLYCVNHFDYCNNISTAGNLAIVQVGCFVVLVIGIILQRVYRKQK